MLGRRDFLKTSAFAPLLPHLVKRHAGKEEGHPKGLSPFRPHELFQPFSVQKSEIIGFAIPLPNRSFCLDWDDNVVRGISYDQKSIFIPMKTRGTNGKTIAEIQENWRTKLDHGAMKLLLHVAKENEPVGFTSHAVLLSRMTKEFGPGLKTCRVGEYLIGVNGEAEKDEPTLVFPQSGDFKVFLDSNKEGPYYYGYTDNGFGILSNENVIVGLVRTHSPDGLI